jgi:AhpD family alkylhydroperoxidase
MTGKEEFNKEREELTEILLDKADLTLKRFMSLETQAYKDGALSPKTKELLGLVASVVLRCDDCIRYHTIKCHESGVSEDEFIEALSISVVVGGSITIPHVRRTVKFWGELA